MRQGIRGSARALVVFHNPVRYAPLLYGHRLEKLFPALRRSDLKLKLPFSFRQGV